MKWTNIPDVYKGAVALVFLTIGGYTYHEKFITNAEASEEFTKVRSQMVQQQVATTNQIQYLLVLNMESNRDILIKEKAAAVAAGDTAEAEKLGQNIQSLRDRIKGLCDQLSDC